MLNKEMLLNSAKKDDGKVIIHVGEYGTSTYGYSQDEGYGSISRTPYWLDSMGYTFYLAEISSEFKLGQSVVFLHHVEGKTADTINLSVKCSNGNTATFTVDNYRYGTDDNVTLFPYGDSGKTLTLEFNPPPDGYM